MAERPEPIRCPLCGLKLAERVRGVVVSVHRGRTFESPRRIGCDRKGCGGVWRAPDDAVAPRRDSSC